MMISPYEKYRQSSVKTSTPGQLLIMLFDGAIRFTKAGAEGIAAADIQKTNQNFVKAQAIMSELMATLDPGYSISNSLFSIYEYIRHLMIQANVKKDQSLAEEALTYLNELRVTWMEASKANISQDHTHGR